MNKNVRHRSACLSSVLLCCVLLCCSTWGAQAEEEKKSTEDAVENSAPAEEKSLEAGGKNPPTAVDPLKKLQKILEGMKLSSELIRKSEAGAATKTTQPQVVKDLDELIQFLESQANSSPPMPPDPPQQPQQPMDQDPMSGEQQPQPKPQNSGEPGKQQPVSGEPEEGRAKESTERKKPPQAPREGKSLSGQQLYEKEVWGHLPPALRRELMNVYSEKYIPQYEELVRRYYESLAEGNRRRDSSR